MRHFQNIFPMPVDYLVGSQPFHKLYTIVARGHGQNPRLHALGQLNAYPNTKLKTSIVASMTVAGLPCSSFSAARTQHLGQRSRPLVSGSVSGPREGFSNAFFRSLGLPSLIENASLTDSNRRVRTRMHGGVAGVGG